MKLNEYVKILSEKKLSVLEFNWLWMWYEVCGALHTDKGLWMAQNSRGGDELFFSTVDSSHGQEMSLVHHNSSRNS